MSADTGNKILFVDDEVNLLDAVKRRFHTHYQIETASDPDKAIELIKTSGPFAVVVSDYRMDSMDGLKFLGTVREMHPDTVCVMLTGFADLEVAVAAVNEQQIFRFLTKPCPNKVLRETLDAALDQYRRAMTMSTYTYSVYVENNEPVWTERSNGCLAVTGYDGHDFSSDPTLWLSMVLPEYRNTVKAEHERVIAGEQVPPIEFKIRQKNGEVRSLRDTIIPRRNKDGIVCGYDGMVEDITQQTQMQDALKQSQARYEKMVANAPGLVYQFIMRSAGDVEFLFLSDSCSELFGLEPDQIKENASLLMDKFEPEDRSEFYRLIAASVEDLSPCQWLGCGVFKEKTKWFQSVARPERLENGDILWDGLLLDLTEYKLIERQVAQIAKFPAENPNPVLRIADDGTILYANKASQPMLSLWDRVTGQKLPEEIYQFTRQVKASGTDDCVDVQCKDQIFSIVIASIPEEDYVNLYARDITDVKLVEMELIRANKVLQEHDRLKSEFVSTVSHELRTPLCIFKNIVSNAMAGVMGKVSHKLFESLKMADTSIDRLSRIVADFLDISKIESGMITLNFTDMPVQDVIEEVVESLRALSAAKSIELKSDMPKTAINVMLDHDRVIQVLTNLIGNAIKFIPVNSTIEVALTDCGESVQIAVRDNGPGLNQEEAAKIFDRFVQVQVLTGPGEHGTGLGLTIAKELVEMHNGSMWVESEPGHGCRFTFTLPKRPPVKEQSQPTQELTTTLQ